MRALLPYLHRVSDGMSLSREQAAMFMGALRARGETVDELVGFATTPGRCMWYTCATARCAR